jgi:hypothetical protein
MTFSKLPTPALKMCFGVDENVKSISALNTEESHTLIFQRCTGKKIGLIPHTISPANKGKNTKIISFLQQTGCDFGPTLTEPSTPTILEMNTQHLLDLFNHHGLPTPKIRYSATQRIGRIARGLKRAMGL